MEWTGPRSQRKTNEIVKTFNDIKYPHMKSEYQGCTCETDKSLKRGMRIKFESRKICIAGNQCNKSDLDIHNAEDKKLPVFI